MPFIKRSSSSNSFSVLMEDNTQENLQHTLDDNADKVFSQFVVKDVDQVEEKFTRQTHKVIGTAKKVSRCAECTKPLGSACTGLLCSKCLTASPAPSTPSPPRTRKTKDSRKAKKQIKKQSARRATENKPKRAVKNIKPVASRRARRRRRRKLSEAEYEAEKGAVSVDTSKVPTASNKVAQRKFTQKVWKAKAKSTQVADKPTQPEETVSDDTEVESFSPSETETGSETEVTVEILETCEGQTTEGQTTEGETTEVFETPTKPKKSGLNLDAPSFVPKSEPCTPQVEGHLPPRMMAMHPMQQMQPMPMQMQMQMQMPVPMHMVRPVVILQNQPCPVVAPVVSKAVRRNANRNPTHAPNRPGVPQMSNPTHIPMRQPTMPKQPFMVPQLFQTPQMIFNPNFPQPQMVMPPRMVLTKVVPVIVS